MDDDDTSIGDAPTTSPMRTPSATTQLPWPRSTPSPTQLPWPRSTPIQTTPAPDTTFAATTQFPRTTATTVAPTPPETDAPPTPPPITDPTTPPPSFSTPGPPPSTSPGQAPPPPPSSPNDPAQPSPSNPGTTRTNRSPQPTSTDTGAGTSATQPPGDENPVEQSTPLASTQFPLTTSAPKPPFVLPGGGPSPSSAVPTTTKKFVDMYDSPFARFDPNRRVSTRQDSFMTAFIVMCTVCLLVAIMVRLFSRVRPAAKLPTSTNAPYQSNHDSATSLSEPQINWRNLGDIQLDTSAIELSSPLAAGSYGVVWRATLHTNVVVAVKTCTRTSLDDVQNFVDELALLSTLHSPYLVMLLGVAWTKASDLKAVLEFMDSGDLCEKLAATKDTSFPWRHKLESALSIAHALVYLKTQHVIHRDLKSRNVLLDSKVGTKLADFGISKHHDDTHASMTTGVGTYRWMAPEVLTFRRYTISVDVYSFGVLLTELDTHRLPFTDVQNDHGHNIADAAVVCMVLYEDLRPTFSAHCPSWYVELGRRCMHADAAERPAPEEIVDILSRELFNAAVDVPTESRRRVTGS